MQLNPTDIQHLTTEIAKAEDLSRTATTSVTREKYRCKAIIGKAILKTLVN